MKPEHCQQGPVSRLLFISAVLCCERLSLSPLFVPFTSESSLITNACFPRDLPVFYCFLSISAGVARTVAVERTHTSTHLHNPRLKAILTQQIMWDAESALLTWQLERILSSLLRLIPACSALIVRSSVLCTDRQIQLVVH